MRRSLIAGNWKMFKTAGEASAFASELMKIDIARKDDRDVVICPPFTALQSLKEGLEGSGIMLGAQNVFYEEQGAYTGEISPSMLLDMGVEYVICGHSERRTIFGESNNVVNRKLKAVERHGMVPILCVGESLQERESGKTFDVLSVQMQECLEGYPLERGIPVIAYEPLWAIGTGKTATPEQAQQVHDFLRNLLSETYGQGLSGESVLLYGGSVKPENIDSLMEQKDVDGVLVGGASLDAESFGRIIEYRTG